MSATIVPFNLSDSGPFEWNNFLFKPLYAKGDAIILKGFESDYKGLRILVINDKIRLSNSLHKFYKGNNYSDFSYSQLKKSIDEICLRTGIDPNKWEIKKMEFGFNISTLNPAKEYIDSILSFKNREFEKMKAKHIDYGRKCFLSEYAIKIYDKSVQTKLKDKLNIANNILRIEIYYGQKRKLPKGLRTLVDFKKEDCIRSLYNDLNLIIGKIDFKDQIDFSNTTPDERVIFFAALNCGFLKVEEKLNKSQVPAIKARIKSLKAKCLKKGLKPDLLKSLSNKFIELFCT